MSQNSAVLRRNITFRSNIFLWWQAPDEMGMNIVSVCLGSMQANTTKARKSRSWSLSIISKVIRDNPPLVLHSPEEGLETLPQEEQEQDWTDPYEDREANPPGSEKKYSWASSHVSLPSEQTCSGNSDKFVLLLQLTIGLVSSWLPAWRKQRKFFKVSCSSSRAFNRYYYCITILILKYWY